MVNDPGPKVRGWRRALLPFCPAKQGPTAAYMRAASEVKARASAAGSRKKRAGRLVWLASREGLAVPIHLPGCERTGAAYNGDRNAFGCGAGRRRLEELCEKAERLKERSTEGMAETKKPGKDRFRGKSPLMDFV